MDNVLLRALLKNAENKKNTSYRAEELKAIVNFVFNKQLYNGIYIERVDTMLDVVYNTLRIDMDIMVCKDDVLELNEALNKLEEIIKGSLGEYADHIFISFNKVRMPRVLNNYNETYIELEDFEILVKHILNEDVKCYVDEESSKLMYKFNYEKNGTENSICNDYIEKYLYNHYGLYVQTYEAIMVECRDVKYVLLKTLSEQDVLDAVFKYDKEILI